MSNDTAPAPGPTPAPTPKHAIIVWSCIIIVALGLVVAYNYVFYLKTRQKEYRPPYAARITAELTGTTSEGQEFKLSSMMGQVYVASYLYTVCPSGCAGIADHMAKLQKKFGGNPKFSLLSLTLNAEFDTPEMLKVWTDKQGLSGDNWKFVTGNAQEIRDFMEKQFKLPRATEIPVALRKNEFDLWSHPLAIVLVDHAGRIRGAYYPLDDAFGDVHTKNLDRDIQLVLDEADGKTPPPANLPASP